MTRGRATSGCHDRLADHLVGRVRRLNRGSQCQGVASTSDRFARRYAAGWPRRVVSETRGITAAETSPGEPEICGATGHPQVGLCP